MITKTVSILSYSPLNLTTSHISEAEVVIVAAHAVYKEHMVLLMDCLVAWTG